MDGQAAAVSVGVKKVVRVPREEGLGRRGGYQVAIGRGTDSGTVRFCG